MREQVAVIMLKALAKLYITENSMPLPIAHALLGGAVCVASDRDGVAAGYGRLALAAVLANGADLDYLPGMLVGEPHRFHRMAAHSLGWAVLVALLAAWLVRRGWVPAWPVRPGWPSGAAGTALIVALLWASHVLLDSLNADYSEPIGVMMFWPLSSVWVPVIPLFYNIDKISGPASPLVFARSLVTSHNLRAILFEVALMGPLLGAAIWWRRQR